MPKDMRQIVKDATQNELELPKGHRNRFEARLTELHSSKKTRSFFFLKIAASIVLMISLGYFVVSTTTADAPGTETLPEMKITSLGSVSPEMEKVENYYLTAINYELASLEKTPENQRILDDYLEKIGKLDDDYKRLSTDLTNNGVNEKTINALITNLQLQLQLLLQLKDEINELKTANTITNEDSTI